ncbi:hypothetical protein DGo_CA0253 [Deinococcus gobiensis I-0]|uniref:Uncharacterized protein n=1 Tax=Deinococcus gobiensis (strain DSM 21396 / JCM 16679 / CGMCC 1.7299 / I-0) TaxID=745776 RepID=H8GU38_DEIGI|nr:hypothetical protein DGo_CA0253 [Deinococcus gobiensis I-0]
MGHVRATAEGHGEARTGGSFASARSRSRPAHAYAPPGNHGQEPAGARCGRAAAHRPRAACAGFPGGPETGARLLPQGHAPASGRSRARPAARSGPGPQDGRQDAAQTGPDLSPAGAGRGACGGGYVAADPGPDPFRQAEARPGGPEAGGRAATGGPEGRAETPRAGGRPGERFSETQPPAARRGAGQWPDAGPPAGRRSRRSRRRCWPGCPPRRGPRGPR